jgi:hypothetical protein
MYVRTVALGTALLLPWLYPMATGPSPSVDQWLVSMLAIALLVAAQPSLSTAADQKLVLQMWVTAATINALVGALQYAGLLEGLSTVISSPAAGQAFGMLRQRNQYASLLLIGLAALLALHQTSVRKSFALGVAALLSAGCAMSASRTGAVGMMFLCIYGIAMQGRQKGTWPLLSCAVGAYLSTSVLGPELLQFTLGISTQSVFDRAAADAGCGSRTVLWSNVMHLIGQKPLLGWGWGELDYAHYITLYPEMRFCDILDNAHNLPLHVAVELGLPAAGLLCSAVIAFVVRGKPWKEADSFRRAAWSVLALIAIHSMVEYPLWYGPFLLTFVLCFALLWRKPASDGSHAKPSRSPNPRRLWAAGGAACVALLACIAWWDYHRISQLYRPYSQRSVAYQGDIFSKVGNSWLFSDQVRFALLTTMSLSPENAENAAKVASELLHFSPEPRVIEILIESLVILDRRAEALVHMVRYRAAFPQQYEAWVKSAAK